MIVHASTSVHEDAEIELVGAERWADSVAIAFGDREASEQVTIDFYDPGMLDRVAEIATRGAALLRAKLAELVDADDPYDVDPATVDDDRPVEPGAS